MAELGAWGFITGAEGAKKGRERRQGGAICAGVGQEQAGFVLLDCFVCVWERSVCLCVSVLWACVVPMEDRQEVFITDVQNTEDSPKLDGNRETLNNVILK